MWLFVARCCAVLRAGREGGATEDTENTEGRGWGLPIWRVGSFCISGFVVRVGVVWRALEQVGAWGMSTLADDGDGEAAPGTRERRG